METGHSDIQVDAVEERQGLLGSELRRGEEKKKTGEIPPTPTTTTTTPPPPSEDKLWLGPDIPRASTWCRTKRVLLIGDRPICESGCLEVFKTPALLPSCVGAVSLILLRSISSRPHELPWRAPGGLAHQRRGVLQHAEQEGVLCGGDERCSRRGPQQGRGEAAGCSGRTAGAASAEGQAERHGELGSEDGREEPVTSVQPGPEAPRVMGAEEQRLEATLTALKQQLSRLRKQDVGLKSHLQQLDQQISELKLDVSKASTEQLESDSRPSSGFYELSDGGSYSLSNSCTSVYSECLSSSQTSLLLLPMSPATSLISPPSQVDVCRRRSADESTTQPNPPRATGLHLGSSRIRASTTGTEQTRPRPVSTGDLDRMLAQGPSYSKSADVKKPLMGQNLKTSTLDSKFQSNLVSRSGAEVYHYPSPLHAVALQSPIFSHGGNPATAGLLEGQGPPMIGSDTLQRAQMGYETKTLGYIDKLLLRSFSKIQSVTDTETLQSQRDYHRKPTEVVTVFPEVSQKEVCMLQPLSTQATNITPQDNDKRGTA
ncbi:hypothetical protein INR49_009823 [Caranx melampygus]|nr:hypothetical protein INR49_009823 [Caranx melampygus]